MKKIIRLTESDLTRIVRRVIKEQTLLGVGEPVKIGGRSINLSKSTWISVVLVLKNKFTLPYGPSGCNGYL